jgi:hypothetical protein
MSIKKGQVVFAYQMFIVDFKTKEDAQDYQEKNSDKHWFFKLIGNKGNCSESYDYLWTLEIRKPMKGYNGGW